jgi:hypothetical protein
LEVQPENNFRATSFGVQPSCFWLESKNGMMINAIANIEMLPHELDINITSTKINLGELFAPRGRYLNELSLFKAHFNAIPNLISEINIDCKKANNWSEENYQSEIKKNTS